jgi:ATP-binding cassette subfamily B protein
LLPSSSKNLDLHSVLTDQRLAGLWQLMSGYRFNYLGANISLAIAALSKTATFLLLRYFIDNLQEISSTTANLTWIAVGFIGLASLEGSFTFLSGRLAAQTSEGIAQKLRNYLFDHIQRLSFSYHSLTPTGELIQRATSDVEAIRKFFADQAINIGRIFFLFIVNFTVIMTMNWKLGLISIIIIPFVLGLSIFFFKKITRIYEAYQEQEAKLSTVLQENLSGIRVVKAFARQNFEIKKFERDNWEKFLRGKSLAIAHSLFWPFSDVLCGLQLIGGYLTGALMAIDGTISTGTYLAYAGMIIWLIFPIRTMGRLIVQMSSGLVSYHRVYEIIKQERESLGEDQKIDGDRIKGDILFSDVCFEYEDGTPVLKNINFHCRPGSSVAILGSTGSGKTTLVNLLPRFFEYSKGHILLDGKELSSIPRRFLRQQIGIVEQEPFLFSRTIQENIIYGAGRNVTMEEIISAAKAASIHDVISSFPQGYNTLIGEKGVTLSGGQKQRVAIARTILKNPSILILDDSTSSIDTETEAEIQSALKMLMKDRTTLIIAHRIQSIMNADLILVMQDGEIIERGTHEELIKLDGIYRKIFDLQTRIEVELEEEINRV